MDYEHQQTLRESEERYRELIEQINDHAIFLIDTEGRPTTWNLGVKRTLGFDEWEFIGHDITPLIFTPEDLRNKEHEKELQHAREHGTASDDRWLRRKDGSLFWASGTTTALRDASGNLVGFSKVFRDQTEAKKTHEALHESQQRLDLILETASEYAIIITDLAGRILNWNTGAANIFRYAADEIVGRNASVLFTPEDQASDYPKREMENALRNGRAINERWQQRKDGSRFWASGIAHCMRDDEGCPRGYLKIIRDWTEQKLSTDKLERTVGERTSKLRETVNELEAFSYSIAHDMRAPLRAMQGFGTMLREELGDNASPEALDYLRRITASANRLDLLIQDVLNYSKLVRAELRLTPVSPEKLLREIIESYPNLHPPKATIQIQPGIPEVLANRAALTQAFANLLGNAVKFVAPGVHPQIAVWSERVSYRREPNAPENEFVRIFFKDNGIGIPREAQGRLFQMFQRLHTESRYEGTGIGLAIVRKAAERMGGKVDFQSEVGKGSTFWIDLKPAPKS